MTTAQKNVIVIGAGPAGMMAAARAAELGAKVLLLEKTKSTGNKLRITGQGRCNITNQGDIEKFVENYGPNGVFLYNCFHRFFNVQLVEFLEANGVEVAAESDGRVFPRSNLAGDVVALLKRVMNKHRVTVLTRKRVIKLISRDGAIRAVKCDNGRTYTCDRAIVATGGKSYPATGSTGDGYQLARELGHTIVKPYPALVALETAQSFPAKLAGLAVKDVELAMLADNKKFRALSGDLLFTETGISGPVVLALSKPVIERLRATGREVEVAVNFARSLSPEALDLQLVENLSANGRLNLKNMLQSILPARLAAVFLDYAGIEPGRKCSDVTREERRVVVQALQDFRLTISDHRPIEEAVVTAGGIALGELDPQTMESKLVKNLYFCGEVIDIDGQSGGYNLQAAFSTGYVAGETAALSFL